MAQNGTDSVRKHFTASRAVIEDSLADNSFIATVSAIGAMVETCLRDGGKVLLAGNGGSAADAQHIAGELVSRLNFDRAPLAGIALTVDSSVLTAIGNDYGYEKVFERQIRGLGRRGDVFIAISTSGRSPNILRAVEAAKELGIHTVAMTGNADAPLAGACELALKVPSGATPLIQQVHIAAAHAICELVENAIFGKARQ
jgi:D-sedoheptulose 7-phosphate isomerase